MSIPNYSPTQTSMGHSMPLIADVAFEPRCSFNANDQCTPLIIGRPFRNIEDVYAGTLSMEFGDDII